jgi:hypothetical protein
LQKTWSSGKIDSQTALDLESAINRAEAAYRIGQLAGQRASSKGYAQLKADLDILSETPPVHPTLNVCRHICAEYAQHCIVSGNFKLYCDTLRCYMNPGEDVDDRSSLFDSDNPVLAYVCPTADDEEAAQNPERGENPKEGVAEIINWEKDVFVIFVRPVSPCGCPMWVATRHCSVLSILELRHRGDAAFDHEFVRVSRVLESTHASSTVLSHELSKLPYAFAMQCSESCEGPSVALTQHANTNTHRRLRKICLLLNFSFEAHRS